MKRKVHSGGFRFPEPKRGQVKPEPGPKLAEEPPGDENLPTEIQGHGVDSKEEARCAVALEILGYEYIYQYPIFGGSDFRGGQILDFLVESVPLPRPLFVQSSYWHQPTKKPDDRLNIYWVKSRTKGRWGDPVEIWDYEAKSIEQAVSRLAFLLGRPG